MSQTEGYDYAEPVTVGGTTGTYTAVSPFPDRAEVAVLSVVFTDTGYCLVSPDEAPITLSNTQTLGTAENAGVRGVAFNGTANFNVTPDAIFWPVGLRQRVTINLVVASSHTGYVSLVFRRAHGTPHMVQPYQVDPYGAWDSEYSRQLERAKQSAEGQQERKGRVER